MTATDRFADAARTLGSLVNVLWASGELADGVARENIRLATEMGQAWEDHLRASAHLTRMMVRRTREDEDALTHLEVRHELRVHPHAMFLAIEASDN